MKGISQQTWFHAVYHKGALDMKNKIVESLEQHYKKVDIHDEFENTETKAYLKALASAIATVKTTCAQ